jgi:ribosome-associated protein
VTESDFIIINAFTRIPASEVHFRFSPSRGPGGQHVNRAHTRATLLFDIANSPSLDEETRERLLTALAMRLDKLGVLHITAQDSRSQRMNRGLAISRFVALLAAALQEQPERVATRPPVAAREKRITEKKKRGTRKKERRRDWWPDT